MFDVSYVDSVVALDSIQLHGDIKVLRQRVSCKVLADLTIGQLDVDCNYLWICVVHFTEKSCPRVLYMPQLLWKVTSTLALLLHEVSTI